MKIYKDIDKISITTLHLTYIIFLAAIGNF